MLITLGATKISCFSAGGEPVIAAIALRPCSTMYWPPVIDSALIGTGGTLPPEGVRGVSSSVLLCTSFVWSWGLIGTVLIVPSQFSLYALAPVESSAKPTGPFPKVATTMMESPEKSSSVITPGFAYPPGTPVDSVAGHGGAVGGRDEGFSPGCEKTTR